MTIQNYPFIYGKTKILNLDTDGSGNIIAYLNNKTIVINEHTVQIERNIESPIVRILDSEKFLLADAECEDSINCFFYDIQGRLRGAFFAGGPIEDIIIHMNKIVISYYDYGVYGGSGPNEEGLAIFDFYGYKEFGVNSSRQGIFIDACYSICKYTQDSILFHSYASLKLCELNLNTFRISTIEAPETIAGAAAMSSGLDKIYFHSGYHHERKFCMWDRKTNEVVKFGDHAQGLRGLRDGKFLAYGSKSYTILNAAE